MNTSVFEPLPRGRALTTDEARLAGELAQVAGDELFVQVSAASVVASCRCGCSSVRLTTVGPPVSDTWLLARSARGRADHLAVTACGRRQGSGPVTVTLHVVHGRVAELELFDPERGEGHHVDASHVRELEDPVVH